jgi:hypothetical protein
VKKGFTINSVNRPNGYITWLKTQKIGAKEPGANLYVHEPQEEYTKQPDEP